MVSLAGGRGVRVLTVLYSVLAPESVLVGYDKKSQELLMMQPLEELEDDLELRISLLNR